MAKVKAPKDYTGLITGDPFYMQQQQLLSAQSVADQARLGERLSQLVVDFGEVPAGFSSPYLPGTAAGLAAQNTQAGLSMLARLTRQQEDLRRGTVDSLASRGILSSGETGFQLGRVQQAGLESQYDARRGVLDVFGQLNDAYSQAELARKLALIDAAMGAYGRQADRPANQPTGPIDIPGVTSPAPAPGSTTPPAAPSAQEMALMAKWVPYAHQQRPDNILALFAKYADWRNAQAAQGVEWWKGPMN